MLKEITVKLKDVVWGVLKSLYDPSIYRDLEGGRLRKLVGLI